MTTLGACGPSAPATEPDLTATAVPPSATPLPTAASTSLPRYELYEGFVILGELNLPTPDYVTPAPHFDYEAQSIEFSDLDKLVEYVPFALYLPTWLPDGMEFKYGTVAQNSSTQNIDSALIDFDAQDDSLSPRHRIVITLSPYYSRPYPVSLGVWIGSKPGYPEKVSFTPAPGLLVLTVAGYNLFWISDEIAYRVYFENHPFDNVDYASDHKMVEQFATSLAAK